MDKDERNAIIFVDLFVISFLYSAFYDALIYTSVICFCFMIYYIFKFNNVGATMLENKES